MKTLGALSLSLALLLGVTPVHADEDGPTEVVVPLDLARASIGVEDRFTLARRFASQEQDARHMRDAGIATTIVGTILTAIGVGLVVTNLCFDDCEGNQSDTALALGGLALGLGQGGVIAGIPMWAVGQARASRAEEIRLSLTPTRVQVTF